MTFKKWQKPPKKWQKMSDLEAKKVENVVTTVVENKISDVEPTEPTITPLEEENVSQKSVENLIWTVWETVVAKPKWRIVFEAQVAPVPMFKMPPEIREYLTNNGFNTDLWKKDKEWLEKHNVDMEMVEKLKKFLTERL